MLLRTVKVTMTFFEESWIILMKFASFVKREMLTYKDDFVEIVVIENDDVSWRRTRYFRLDASFLCDAG